MNRKIELLAPGGDVDAIKAAILAGADAVYCGLDRFNARNRAANITFENLQGILRIAHKHNCEVFLTLNILILESEIPSLFALLNRLVNTSIDGVIVQDLGMFYLLNKYFKTLEVHASTQATTHNGGQVKFLGKLNANRVNLSRELSLDEIKYLSAIAHENNVLTEVFIHGSYCISFSGICYMSSAQNGKSGNRGRCSQPCRDRYETTAAGLDYPLNLKDNSAFFDLKDLYDAGVASLKIEGRIKEYEYVYTVVKTYKNQLLSLLGVNSHNSDNSALHKVFNRDFTNGFLKGKINRDMFIDDPMSYSTKRLAEENDYSSKDEMIAGQKELYQEKEDIRTFVKSEIDKLEIAKIPLSITVTGKSGFPMEISVKTPDTTFLILSEDDLVNVGTQDLNRRMVEKKLKAINETEYYIQHLDMDRLEGDVSVPYRELNAMRKEILFRLNNSKAPIEPIDVPVLKKGNVLKTKPSLSILISSINNTHLLHEKDTQVYFQLPEGMKHESARLIEVFKSNPQLIPWFPSVLIGEDYTAAVQFLQKVKPRLIVTNNTGIAWEAWQNEIPWIAGPFLNITNSFSLRALKENFKCSGAFISNELNQEQIRGIKCPEDFECYYSIFHPIVLMTSRQCLFQQVTGCEKNILDKTCIQKCVKSSSITNLKKDTFLIQKSKGNYHRVYGRSHYLNTEIMIDLPDFFSGFMIDLTDVKTETDFGMDKKQLIQHFKNLLNGIPDSENEVHELIHPTTNAQYKKGI